MNFFKSQRPWRKGSNNKQSTPGTSSDSNNDEGFVKPMMGGID